MSTQPKRRGDPSNPTWDRILDATEEIMLSDGYAAATVRRIAEAAGITPAAVIFYFGTVEELFVALVRRRGERQRERHLTALASPRPLHALWAVANDRSGARLLTELHAVANHRDAVRVEFTKWAKEFRRMHEAGLSRRPGGWHLGGQRLEAVELVSLVAYLSRSLVVEEALGVTTGVSSTRALIEHTIDLLEPDPDNERPQPRRRRTT